MKLFVGFFGFALEWIVSIVSLPIHVRALLQARTRAAEAQWAAARSSDLSANAAVMATMWQLGSDYRPLARYIAARIYDYYGVAPSSVSPDRVVPIDKKS